MVIEHEVPATLNLNLFYKFTNYTMRFVHALLKWFCKWMVDTHEIQCLDHFIGDDLFDN